MACNVTWYCDENLNGTWFRSKIIPTQMYVASIMAPIMDDIPVGLLVSRICQLQAQYKFH